ncbi:DUF3419 family protein [Roseimaritima ulvae]|uniref:S-adenosylmethionine:diacylglycerol 3-amino-3-carboxypropyl transferase n=1 Tax=Roseimaritima ulvae TaxID=980254 RepID=A0A5B9QKH1_9BACT|nr:DUF3419 family protein [Roseimaritima ulvae]QEG38242.1 hypothetical protein UC8_01970 [Roseimaritima ulvae]
MSMELDSKLADDAIQLRAEFDFVRYANCWEDADLLVQALRPGPNKRILSIASSGDNSLALLATGAEVVAADLNAAQLACVELRCAAFRHLEYEQLLAFLGVHASVDRLSTYQRLQQDLTAESKAFWSQREPEITRGIIHIGKFETYFQTFRTRVLPLIHGPKTIARMLQAKTEEERIVFWNETWNNRRWRLLLRVFFSRFLMSRMGRDPEFFRYVEGSIGDQIQKRTRHALCALPTDSNPYLMYIATGNFSNALPRYLQRSNFEKIRDGLDRLTLYHGPIEQAAAVHGEAGFDGYNLSDIFEYVSDSTTQTVYGELVQQANAGARLAYWNAFVPRSCPEQYRDRVKRLTEQSAELFAQDKAFFYGHFELDEVQVPV